MSNIRDLMQQHDTAVAVMTEAAKEMQTPGLNETRLKELQDKFDKAEPALKQRNASQKKKPPQLSKRPKTGSAQP
jgi:hypothetical protein